MIQTASGPIEYTIYTYDRPVPRQKGQTSWKRHATITDVKIALDEAQALLKTSKFARVEIKKKFYDPRENRVIDKTHKVLETSGQKKNPWILAAGLTMAVVLAFWGGYFLTASL